MKGGGRMEIEIVCEGSEDIFELKNLGCCFPPGTMSLQWPEPE